ncbi:FABP family protein [Oceanitalea stevensii]|uniref:Ferric nitrobindin-like protein n=1 Tax=Oceanitalea stevensii TaxID=2763072 RepID=A0ABR8Z0U4_9MICO|nr:FABP family protein [Oceanitalea stevensii]MBD8061787.1 FABP family protein [Oceanitalea stevensii]
MATFTLPEGLAPEVYPLAWLVGSWRGYGVMAYPGVPEQPLVHEMTFDHDGGPYLRCTSTLWAVDAEHSSSVSQEMPGAVGAELLAKAEVWATETAYWRVSPAAPGEPSDSETPPGQRSTDIEVLVAQPTGHVVVYVGSVRPARIDIVSDAVVRTASAQDVSASSRMYGLVQGDLLWVEELAAFGQELQSYASGRLSRQEQA